MILSCFSFAIKWMVVVLERLGDLPFKNDISKSRNSKKRNKIEYGKRKFPMTVGSKLQTKDSESKADSSGKMIRKDFSKKSLAMESCSQRT
jgi:hypothetical protein